MRYRTSKGDALDGTDGVVLRITSTFLTTAANPLHHSGFIEFTPTAISAAPARYTNHCASAAPTATAWGGIGAAVNKLPMAPIAVATTEPTAP